MSQNALTQIIDRMSKDPQFQTQVSQGSADALSGYELTPEEREALLSRDAGKLKTLGVDERARAR